MTLERQDWFPMNCRRRLAGADRQARASPRLRDFRTATLHFRSSRLHLRAATLRFRTSALRLGVFLFLPP